MVLRLLLDKVNDINVEDLKLHPRRDTKPQTFTTRASTEALVHMMYLCLASPQEPGQAGTRVF